MCWVQGHMVGQKANAVSPPSWISHRITDEITAVVGVVETVEIIMGFALVRGTQGSRWCPGVPEGALRLLISPPLPSAPGNLQAQ